MPPKRSALLHKGKRPLSKRQDLPKRNFSSLLSNNLVYFNAEICNSSAAELVDKLLSLAADNEVKDVTLLINSPGGSAAQTFHILDIMSKMPYNISTYGSGEVCSGGTLLLMGGMPGRRYIAKNTLIMSHTMATELEGKYHELEAGISGIKQTHARIKNFVVQATCKSEKYILKNLLNPVDAYMTAELAVKHGIADYVV